MLKNVFLVIVAALALLLVYAATRPNTFRVERSERIQAAPDKLFPLINDLHGFNTWNPYLKKDPATQGQYKQTAAGPGASYAWQSDPVGAGSMTILEAAPGKITMRLDFLTPFEASNTAEFTLQPVEGATQVTWAMFGPANFMSKLMASLTLLDRMVGNDFATGLANLKAIAETR